MKTFRESTYRKTDILSGRTIARRRVLASLRRELGFRDQTVHTRIAKRVDQQACDWETAFRGWDVIDARSQSPSNCCPLVVRRV